MSVGSPTAKTDQTTSASHIETAKTESTTTTSQPVNVGKGQQPQASQTPKKFPELTKMLGKESNVKLAKVLEGDNVKTSLALSGSMKNKIGFFGFLQKILPNSLASKLEAKVHVKDYVDTFAALKTYQKQTAPDSGASPLQVKQTLSNLKEALSRVETRTEANVGALGEIAELIDREGPILDVKNLGHLANNVGGMLGPKMDRHADVLNAVMDGAKDKPELFIDSSTNKLTTEMKALFTEHAVALTKASQEAKSTGDARGDAKFKAMLTKYEAIFKEEIKGQNDVNSLFRGNSPGALWMGIMTPAHLLGGAKDTVNAFISTSDKGKLEINPEPDLEKARAKEKYSLDLKSTEVKSAILDAVDDHYEKSGHLYTRSKQDVKNAVIKVIDRVMADAALEVESAESGESKNADAPKSLFPKNASKSEIGLSVMAAIKEVFSEDFPDELKDGSNFRVAVELAARDAMYTGNDALDAVIMTTLTDKYGPNIKHFNDGFNTLMDQFGIVSDATARNQKVAQMPQELADEMKVLYDTVKAKFGEDEAVKSVAANLMLRGLSPMVAIPHHNGVSEKLPDGKLQANLTVLSKMIQAVGNGVAFGKKEAHMIPFNATVQARMTPMTEFAKALVARGRTPDQL